MIRIQWVYEDLLSNMFQTLAFNLGKRLRPLNLWTILSRLTWIIQFSFIKSNKSIYKIYYNLNTSFTLTATTGVTRSAYARGWDWGERASILANTTSFVLKSFKIIMKMTMLQTMLNIVGNYISITTEHTFPALLLMSTNANTTVPRSPMENMTLVRSIGSTVLFIFGQWN